MNASRSLSGVRAVNGSQSTSEPVPEAEFVPIYSLWRHGGWYVDNVQYPSGACGCVSRNYSDRKWRIVCDPRPLAQQPTFATRDEAARAEYALVTALHKKGVEQ
jgi:hypothetical protein